ncbi:MAG: HAMP domain-containing protein, partial [Deltaproteobacteria bacterium]|nr:HAMP domain-containing protein [Deltaproteobacteria bacterium]
MAVFVVVAGLTLIETQVLDLGLDLPVANSILVFALININVLLILVLLFLIVRNIVKLVFDRRAKVMGAKLRTKLVMAFVSLSLIPAAVLFLVTVQFIGTSLEYWFDLQLDRPLQDSLAVGRLYYKASTQKTVLLGQDLAGRIIDQRLLEEDNRSRLAAFLGAKRREFRLSSLKVVSAGQGTVAQALDPDNDLAAYGGPSRDLITQALEQGLAGAEITSSSLGDYVSAAVPLSFSQAAGQKRIEACLILTMLTPEGLMDKLNAIAQGLKEYQQLKIIKGPIKASHYITLSLVTLLIIFGATWFGFQLAKSLTEPLQDLAQGTQRIAAGDYDFSIQAKAGDEVGALIESFNQMTRDLKVSKEGLERANLELRATNREIERRRNYMEIVLTNIAAGVISVDQAGVVTTINPSAEKILGLKTDQVLGRPYDQILTAEQADVFKDLARAAAAAPSGQIETQLRLPVRGRAVSLLLRLTELKNQAGQGLGLVLVIEDLTDLEKAQRVAAWQEVARRIAHEIKNPLTPIKLSAQRLKKRFGREIKEAQVFDQAVGIIIQQVEALKSLVDEFSSFARMPS